jgi:opacity protein-like surface antigen
VHATLEVRGTRLPGGNIPVPVNADVVDVWADVIGGVRVGYEINEKWHVMSAVEVGGGSSRVDWQYLIGGGYNFVDWFALDAAYRILGVDYEQGNVKLDLTIQWLLIGLKFQF